MAYQDNIVRNGSVAKTVSLLVIGWISAIVSIFVYPFIFGPFGVVMGIIGSKNGSRAGVVLIMASIATMFIGVLFGGVILNYTLHYFGL